MEKKLYSCWLVDRGEILSRIHKRAPTTICHHITYEFGKTCSMPPNPKKVVVYGYISISGIDIALVEIDGETNRKIGGKYHITLALDTEMYKPVDSNRIIEENPITHIQPFEISVQPHIVTKGK